jgi:Zn-dependent peptidase ImmA (M78 family)
MASWPRESFDLAIRHELGHALCNDVNERKADRMAKLLEQGKPVSCTAQAGAKQKSRHYASLN